MVNNIGQWTAEKDYSTFPIEQWCDWDYVADFIIKQNYIPKTSIENLTYMIIAHFEGETEDSSSYYFPTYKDNGMINIDGLSNFVKDNGISEFDYEC